MLRMSGRWRMHILQNLTMHVLLTMLKKRVLMILLWIKLWKNFTLGSTLWSKRILMMFVYVHPRQSLSRVSALTISVNCTCELALRLVLLLRSLACLLCIFTTWHELSYLTLIVMIVKICWLTFEKFFFWNLYGNIGVMAFRESHFFVCLSWITLSLVSWNRHTYNL